jgi:hypothetical protein
MWFFTTHEPSVLITTAPTERQVKDIIWREIRHRHKTALLKLPGKPLTMKWDIEANHYALGFSTNSEQQVQGFHSANVMLIIDEANAYPPELYEALLSVISGGDRKILFQIGNPIEPLGPFYQSFSQDNVWTHTISCLNHPNVISRSNVVPGAVTHEWVEDMRKLWTEESIFWEARILGNFPTTAADLVVNLAWVEHAEQLVCNRSKELYMGYDCAEYGDDQHCWTIGTRDKLVHQEAKANIEPTEGAGITKRLQREFQVPYKNITIDGVGAGATMYSFLKADLPGIRRFVASNNAKRKKTFADAQIEAWWHVRGMLNPRADTYSEYSFGGKRDRLKSDLCTRKYHTDKYGRYQLEEKKLYRKRMKRSPDYADSFVLCYSPMIKGGATNFTVLPDVT